MLAVVHPLVNVTVDGFAKVVGGRECACELCGGRDVGDGNGDGDGVGVRECGQCDECCE